MSSSDNLVPQISGVRKAAILTVVLGEELGPEVLKLLDEDEVEAIGREVAKLQNVSSEHAELPAKKLD